MEAKVGQQAQVSKHLKIKKINKARNDHRFNNKGHLSETEKITFSLAYLNTTIGGGRDAKKIVKPQN